MENEMLKVDGYDIVATMNYASGFGEVVVLCNNSSHFLVAVRPSEADEAQLEQSFQYASLDDATNRTGREVDVAPTVYARALLYAARLAGDR